MSGIIFINKGPAEQAPNPSNSALGIGCTDDNELYLKTHTGAVTIIGSAGDFGGGSGGGFTPYFIPSDASFTIPLYSQALAHDDITVEGSLNIDGRLIFIS